MYIIYSSFKDKTTQKFIYGFAGQPMIVEL